MKVAVLGLASEGQKLVQHFLRQGCEVYAAGTIDDKLKNTFIQANLSRPIHWIEAGRDTTRLFQAELWILTSQYYNFSSEVVLAREKGIVVLSDLDYICDQIKGTIVGITGTHGKSTTATFLKSILELSGRRVFVGGNFYADFIDALTSSAEIFIFEASSNTLQRSSKFHPHIAIFTSLSPNHPRRHNNIDEYAQVKISIAARQGPGDYFIVNYLPKIGSLIKDQKIKSKIIKASLKNVAEVNLTVIKDELVWKNKYKLKVATVKFKGMHHLSNLLLASAAANLLGIIPENIIKAFHKLVNLESRFEQLGVYEGVTVINDAAANTPAATAFALEAIEKNALLICGGRWRNGLYPQVLASYLKKYTKMVIIFGEDRKDFFEAWKDQGKCYLVASLKDAVALAFQKAVRGDKIIFSPGSTPHSHEGSYMSWGKEFAKLVATVGEYTQLSKLTDRLK